VELILLYIEIGLEVNADETKYILKSPDQNAGTSHDIKTDKNTFEIVKQFKCLGTNLTNQNSIQKAINSRLKPGNACNHSVQDLLSSSFLYKDIKIKIYTTIILIVVLYGCETW
jgi:hypothetical protein